jgi:predicted XRE-type DNA-binding protein
VRKQNVFDEIGFSPEESSALYIKSKLHSEIIRYVGKKYSQAQLQKILDEPQSRVSDLLRGKIAKFSLDTLVAYANALHMRPEIKTHAPVVTMSVPAQV